MDYKIYFFREKSNTVELHRIVEFFENIAEIETEYGEDAAKFTYNDGVIEGSINFYLKKTLLVPNIYKLNPKYISVNFYADVDPLLPSFCAKIAFNLIEIICRSFDLFIYNSIFENVLPFKMQLLENSYQATKRYAYEQKDDMIYTMEEEKLNDVLKYQRENYALQLYYKDLEVYVPRYVFLKDEEDIVRLAIEWKEGTKTIFPRCLDVVLYKTATEVKVLYRSQIYEYIEKFLSEVPGFTQGTKMIEDKNNKKIKKLMQKSKFNRVTDKFEQIDIEKIIDL